MASNKQDSSPGPRAPARPGDPIDLQESVAGEEDPGASLDIPAARGTGTRAPEEAPAGKAGTGGTGGA